jgi:Rrf2 family transcriptional regulator, cysteine metabolism repressor
MRVSMKAEYGVRALCELAHSDGGGPVQSAEIARRQRVPGPFLDQVLMTLRRAGLIKSVRGPHGGHLLSRPAAEIRLDEVIGCLEGAAPSPTAEGASTTGSMTALNRLALEAEEAARRVYAAHTLADLIRLQREEPPVFHGIFKPVPSRGRRVVRA